MRNYARKLKIVITSFMSYRTLLGNTQKKTSLCLLSLHLAPSPAPASLYFFRLSVRQVEARLILATSTWVRSGASFIDYHKSMTLPQFSWSQIRWSQRDVVYRGWPIAPSYVSPNAGGMGGGGACRVLANEYHCALGAQTNFGDLAPCLTQE